jgi:hypothetical protein
MNELISIGEAAEIWGTSAETIRLCESRGYLIPQRTAGGHRRYYRWQIESLKEVMKNPFVYHIQYETFRKLPSVLKILGDFNIGDYRGWLVGSEPEPQGYAGLEIGTYQKITHNIPTSRYFWEKEIILKDDLKNTGITLTSTNGLYMDPKIEKDVLYLSTFDIWQNMPYPDNRRSMSPAFVWGLELADNNENGIVIQRIYYKRD